MHQGVVQWIGISTDEAHRMRESDVGYMTNRYPLIELGMSRRHCLRWMSDNGYPEPPKSSCTFCPFHSDAHWQDMKENLPGTFAQVVQFEQELQTLQMASEVNPYKGFLHRSLQTIDQVDFTKTKARSGFGNECEGVCGV